MAKITEIPFEIEDHTVDEVVDFYVEIKKRVCNEVMLITLNL